MKTPHVIGWASLLLGLLALGLRQRYLLDNVIAVPIVLACAIIVAWAALWAGRLGSRPRPSRTHNRHKRAARTSC